MGPSVCLSTVRIAADLIFMRPLWRRLRFALDSLWRLVHIRHCSADPVPTRPVKEALMLDFVMLVAGVAFFAIATAYVAACDRM